MFGVPGQTQHNPESRRISKIRISITKLSSSKGMTKRHGRIKQTCLQKQRDCQFNYENRK